MHGIVSFLANSVTNVRVGTHFVGYQQALGTTHVKAKVVTSATDQLPTHVFQAAVETYNAAATPVLLLFDRGFSPVGGEPIGMYPNMPLNTRGDLLMSPYIDAWTKRAMGFLRQILPLQKRRAICWNETDLLALLTPGVNPSRSTDKANALAPEVAGALFWQAARRWGSIGIEMYCGALSVLPQSGQDDLNPYIARYLDAMYRSLERYEHAPWPWRGICINAEGFWTASRFAGAVAEIRKIMTRHGDTGEIIVAEWGVTCKDYLAHPDRLAETYAAITAVCPESYFFQGPGRVPFVDDPALYTDYGAFQWFNEGPEFVAGPDYALGAPLRKLFG